MGVGKGRTKEKEQIKNRDMILTENNPGDMLWNTLGHFQ